MAITAIPGFNVQKVGKDKYSISVNNGNMGAVLLNKAQLKEFADAYGVPVKDNSKTKKTVGLVAAGLALVGAVAAGVIYRKNIAKFFRGLKGDKASKTIENTKSKMSEVYNRVSEFIADKYSKTKEFVRGVFTKRQKLVNTTVFHTGLSPELEKAKRAGIVEYARNIDALAAKLDCNTYRESKLAELLDAFAALTPRSSLK